MKYSLDLHHFYQDIGELKLLIKNSFKEKIKSVFYDKEVKVLENKIIEDKEGGINYQGLEEKDSFLGNVSFSNCKKIQEDYGLDYEINVSITTDYNLLKINDLIKYQEKIYSIEEIIVTDSHYLILGKIWKQ
nr:MAG TPA: hypothetical protein [Caudoviricetes sp.]